jgi:phosphatidate cytidylyltransferase
MNKFLVRLISGAVFVALTVGFLFLRLVDYRLFDIYVAFMVIVGSYELCSKLFIKKVEKDGALVNAGDGIDKLIVLVSMLSAVLIVPAYVFSGLITAISVVLAEILVNAILVIIGKKGKKGFWKVLLSAVYPKVLLTTLSIINAFEVVSLTALVMVFTIGPLTDTLAYLVGSTLKGPKLCPTISPNKTVSGAIGGLLGGIIASVLTYIIFTPDIAMSIPLTVAVFVLAGAIGSMINQAGDLVESYIKRRIGIKDMGKIMPGHGGVLDRVDGVMFVSLFVAILFAIL